MKSFFNRSKSLTSLVFILLVASVSAQVPSYVPTNGLLGWWPFNGNANDESGNGNNGTVNGATLTTDRFGIAEKAFSFDGVSSYIQCNNSGPTSNPTVSVSFWLKSAAPGYSSQILGWGQSQESPGGEFRIVTQHNCPSSIAFDTFQSANNFESNYINEWDFYTVICDAALGNTVSNVSIYKNSVILNQCYISNIFSTNIVNQFPVVFGKDHGQNMAFLSGQLDDIGIWNRVLSADEVLALYNGCNVTPSAVSGNVTPAQFTQETYTYPNTVGSTYNWTITNGVILSGQGTNSVTVMWANSGSGSISVSETNATGCVSDTVSYNVVIIPTDVEEFDNTINLYPNPASTSITLQVNSNLIGKDYIVYDSVGKVIAKDKITSTSHNISTSTFASGNYVVKVGDVVKRFEVIK